jgi:phosphoribosylamine--glycine ligase
MDIEWKPGNSATVVLAAAGYPYQPRKGDVIQGLDDVSGVTVFHAGTAENDAGEFVTSGGRVLGVTATGDDLDQALTACYRELSKISFEGMQYRRDIGR